MDLALKQAFLSKWQKHFPGAELPITFEYTEDERGVPLVNPAEETRCMIGVLQKARKGIPLRFAASTFPCMGGKHYCGYSPRLRKGIEEFLSHDAQAKVNATRRLRRLQARPFGRVRCSPLPPRI